MKYSIFCSLAIWQASSAFNVVPSKKFGVGSKTQLNVFPIEMCHASMQLVDLIRDSSSTTLADVASVSSDGGWWNAYLNIFKSGLLFTHDLIDEPLKSSGIQQTWGLSIALFTAGSYA
jgi:hypothetical protein